MKNKSLSFFYAFKIFVRKKARLFTSTVYIIRNIEEGVKKMEDKFNGATEFEKELAKSLFEILKGKIIDFMEYCIMTHDVDGINNLLKLLEENRF